MKNAEGNIMTLEEAKKLLEEVLVTLAKNAVHNKRLTDYADQLEQYIGYLLEKEKEEQKEEDGSGSTNETTDDAKTE